MKDRIPVNPGRVLITPENGSAAFYATMTRADNPTQEGTPINKNTLLKDATAALFGLGGDAVPDDVLKKLRPISFGTNVPDGSDMIDGEVRFVMDVDEYKVLSYIESNGSQFIDTGVIPTVNTKVETTVNFLSTNTTYNSIFGATGNNSSNQFVVYRNNASSMTGQVGISVINSSGVTITGENKCVLGGGVFQYGSFSAAISSPLNNFNNTIYLFAMNGGGAASLGANMQTSYFKIWEGDTLIRDYVAVMRVSDGAVGMLERVAGEFRVSGSSASFAAGAATGEIIKFASNKGAGYYKKDGQVILITDPVFSKSGALVETGNYTGTGKYGSATPNSLTFGFVPRVVFIGSNATNIFGGYLLANAAGYAFSTGPSKLITTQSGNTIKWYTDSSNGSTIQLNQNGTVYNYIAIG